MKKLLTTILILISLIAVGNSAEYYKSFELNFPNEIPEDVYVNGGSCDNSDCSSVTLSNLELFEGTTALQCMNTALNGGYTVSQFENCMNSAKITNNIVPMSGDTFIVTKVNIPSSNGDLINFLPKGDTYLTKYYKSTSYTCEYDICLNNIPTEIQFEQKENAIAELGQVNIQNTEDDLLPVQIEVPVQIEETVCSAYRYSQPNQWKPEPVEGYADYSAKTNITLTISDDETGAVYNAQTSIVNIEADSCQALAEFEWTPETSMVNQDVNFRIETDVIDKQVSSSIIDWFEVVETIHPKDLSTICYSQLEDFTLSNEPSFDMTSSNSEIYIGEYLYSVFRAGAYRENPSNPVPFKADLYFDNNLITSKDFNSKVDSLDDFLIDLTDEIMSLSEDSYNVTIKITPNDASCLESTSVINTANLELLSPELFNVKFVTLDENSNLIEGVSVVLELQEADDFYVFTPEYYGGGFTDSNGVAEFEDVYRGNYSYKISNEDYYDIEENITIGDDQTYYIVLDEIPNTAPVSSLPETIYAYVGEDIELDLSSYIWDEEDSFEKLNIDFDIGYGSLNQNYNEPYLDLWFDGEYNSELNVQITDSKGLTTTDSIEVIFLEDNQAPSLNLPTEMTEFARNDINFDLSKYISDDYDNFEELEIKYYLNTNGNSEIGVDYTSPEFTLSSDYITTNELIIEVTDSNGLTSSDSILINFIDNVDSYPIIDDFTLESTNGLEVTTNLTLSWETSHTVLGTPMICYLEYLNVNEVVDCDGNRTIFNFDQEGIQMFTLHVIDIDGKYASQGFERKFTKFQPLNELDVSLTIDEEQTLPNIEFVIDINGEGNDKRLLEIIPNIKCGGTNNMLSTPLDSISKYGISSKYSEETKRYKFSIDVSDFKSIVPKDTWCEFEITIVGEKGNTVTVSEIVKFSYPREEVKMQSIRGKGSDILGYMQSAIMNLEQGYNTIEFEVYNNENKKKNLEITVSSRELGFTQTIDENLNSGDFTNIKIPLFIDENMKPGKYSIRYSVKDGSDKQVRYSYVYLR